MTPTASLTATPSASPTITATEGTVISNPIPYPNPATGPGPIQVRIVLQKPAAWLTLKLYTLAFRMVREETFQNLPAGPDDLSLTLTDKWGRDLANGLYYILIETPVGKAKAKLLILR
jgi:hypothetical protein